MKRPILVVAHGSPSEPVPQETAIHALAARLEAALPGHEVRGATLAAEGALDRAVAGLTCPLVLPWFMSDGWFVSTNLPRRLKAAGLSDWQATLPMGMVPGLAGVGLNRLCKEETDRSGQTLVVTAHGSPSDPRPRKATLDFSRSLAEKGGFADVRTGFVDEAPGIDDAARVDGPGIVLPYFAARAGHVLYDMPEALEAAGFTGKVLDPIGTWPETTNHVAGWLASQPLILENRG